MCDLRYIAVLLGLSALVAAQQAGYKDLTGDGENRLTYKKFQRAADCPEPLGRGEEEFIGLYCPPPSHPFKIEIVSFENDLLRLGRDSFALIRLTNTGSEVARIPWSLDPEQIELPNEHGRFDYLMASFSAELKGKKGHAYFSLPVSLYGSESAGGTLLPIKPGEWVDFKIRVMLECQPNDPGCKNLESGKGQFSFTWTDYSRGATYEKCTISPKAERGRVVVSQPVQIELNVTP